MIKPLSADEIRALDPIVDITTAGRCFGLGRTRSYEMARAGTFPVEVLPLGPQSYRVTRISIWNKLGITDTRPAHTAADPGDSGAASRSAA